MPTERLPQIRRLYGTAPSDNIIQYWQPKARTRNREGDCYPHGPKRQAGDERKNYDKRVGRLGNQQIPASALAGKQPGRGNSKRCAKRRDRERSENGSRLLPLRTKQHESQRAGERKGYA